MNDHRLLDERRGRLDEDDPGDVAVILGDVDWMRGVRAEDGGGGGRQLVVCRSLMGEGGGRMLSTSSNVVVSSYPNVNLALRSSDTGDHFP